MKRSIGLLALALLLAPVMGAQDAQQQGGDQEQPAHPWPGAGVQRAWPSDRHRKRLSQARANSQPLCRADGQRPE